MNKLAKVAVGWWITIIVVGLLIFNAGGITDKILAKLPSGQVQPPATPSAPAQKLDLCDVSFANGITMTVGPMKEKWNPSTSVSTIQANVWQSGNDKGRKTDSTTMTVSYGEKIKVLYADGSNSYYKAVQEFTVPCRSTFSTADADLNPQGVHELYAFADIDENFQVYQQDDGLLMTSAATETLAAGDVVTLKSLVTGVYEDAFSPLGKATIICEYGNNYYDAVEVQDRSGNSITATAPAQFSVRNSSNVYDAFEFPSVLSNAEVDFQVLIDVDDTNNPPSGDAGNIYCWLYDQDYFINDQTNAVGFGVSNRTRGDVGQLSGSTGQIANFTIYTA